MISIFNGRSRALGRAEKEDIHIQISVRLREHLHLLKGAKLGVLMAIALHINKQGWAHPSVSVLCAETGYARNTVFDALNDLCVLKIDGHRVLLSSNTRQTDGTFKSNRYLIFPSEEEVALYERKPDEPSTKNHDTAPSTKKRDTEKTNLVKNQLGKTDTHEEEPHSLRRSNSSRRTTHKETVAQAAPSRAVCVRSKFSLEECLRYAEHLKAKGEGIRNPGGYATSIHRSGEADDLIEAFLNAPPPWRVFVESDLKNRVEIFDVDDPRRRLISEVLKVLPSLANYEDFAPLRDELADKGIELC